MPLLPPVTTTDFPANLFFIKFLQKMEDERLLKTDGGRSRTAVRVRPS